MRFEEQGREDPDLPLRVGIGVDSGEAVQLDGGFRGAALNIAARLCGLAQAGEVIATDSVVHLAGRLEGIRYQNRGRVHLKGIPAPVHIVDLRRELSPVQGGGWSWRPLDWSKALGWRLILGVCVIAAVTAGLVVVLTTRGPSGNAASKGGTTSGMGATGSHMGTGQMSSELDQGKKLTPAQRLSAFAQTNHWTCHRVGATSSQVLASDVCSTNVADRLQLTVFRSKRDLRRAYSAQLRRAGIASGSGGCKRGTWGGEVEWFHGAGEPGGRAFCYLSESKRQSYITWTSEAGTPILSVARLDSLFHSSLFFWWANIRHEIV